MTAGLASQTWGLGVLRRGLGVARKEVVLPKYGSRAYNCRMGQANQVASWTERKIDWCCREEQSGCTTTTMTLQPTVAYDCLIRAPSSSLNWSVQRRVWCCAHENRGCDPTSMTTSISNSYDCHAGQSNWARGWSVSKKRWCCAHKGFKCPPGPLARIAKALHFTFVAGWHRISVFARDNTMGAAAVMVLLMAGVLTAFIGACLSPGEGHTYKPLREDGDDVAVDRASWNQVPWLWEGPCWPNRSGFPVTRG